MCWKFVSLLFAAAVLCLVAGTAGAKLVAYYPLDEGSGTTTADASGNNHPGTLQGTPTWVDGPPGYGKALSYNGQSPAAGWVNCGTWNPSAETGQLTVGFWAKWAGPIGPDNWQGVVGKRNDWDATGAGQMWEFEVSASNDQISFFRGGSYPNCGGKVLPVGEWVYVAAAFDGTTLIFYIDGVETGRGAFSFGPTLDATITIGCDNGSGWNAFNGVLDEVRIYDGALSAAEIKKLAAPLGASKPKPADGSVQTFNAVNLTWTAGSTAVAHEVYFGTNYDDVYNGAGNTFVGKQPMAFYLVGFPGTPLYPQGLPLGKTYYWRVDEVAVDGAKYKGMVWSFLVPSKKAYDPAPADGAGFVDPNADLTWSPGMGSIFHQVFFGESFADVNSATEGILTTEAAFEPETLAFDKIYYWRVDEFDGQETHRGDVWSFRVTQAGLGSVMQDIYEDIQGGLGEFKTNGNFPDNPTSSEKVTSFSCDGWGDAKDNYGGRLHGWVHVPVAGDYTFWIAADDEAELWLSRDDDPSNVELIASVPGWTGAQEWEKYPEQKSQAITLEAGRYYMSALWKDYTSGDHCSVAWQGPGIPEREIISGIYVKPFEAFSAFGARPTNKSTGVPQSPLLSWKPGTKAANHDVYFGTDEQAVAQATTATTDIYQGRQASDQTTFGPGTLEWNTTYYWRVDEISAEAAEGPWVGSVWSFTTADFLVVDDFESYNDEEGQGTRIYETWIDGYSDFSSGSTVGYVQPPFAEQQIVHSGGQSMPLDYNNVNSPWYSEAVRTWGTPQNWTINGVEDLTLYFHGNPATYEETAEGLTVSAGGTDIWSYTDEFRFVYKKLNGNGSLTARVDSLVRTDAWAKAGVMIRETLATGAKHAATVITPDNGVSFAYRLYTDDVSNQVNQTGVNAPYWVRITRTGNTFKAEHSADGKAWSIVGTDATASSRDIAMAGTVYIGLCLTSHNANAATTAAFSNLIASSNVSGSWQVATIGAPQPGNTPATLYVALEDSAGKVFTVSHPDPQAVLVTDWTEWKIPLSQFTGVNATKVKAMYLGLGDPRNPSPDGTGLIYIDDIRVTRP
jgi:regulation of enolase protein 1 (concanavalin A-like superfamily)